MQFRMAAASMVGGLSTVASSALRGTSAGLDCGSLRGGLVGGGQKIWPWFVTEREKWRGRWPWRVDVDSRRFTGLQFTAARCSVAVTAASRQFVSSQSVFPSGNLPTSSSGLLPAICAV